jgi:XTP/dITP diphosphohydrolase
MKIVLATKNAGKVREMQAILADLPVEILSAADFPELPDVVEDGKTFTENAVKKAKTVCEATGLVAVADDSGLEVDYLEGAPGIYSARFAGEGKSDLDNNLKLLGLLHDLPMQKRTARFSCVIAVATPCGELHTAEGTCEGLVGYDMRGEKGFGYDPLFYLPEYDKTFAELELDLKNTISHRGRALAGVRDILANISERLAAEQCGLG